MEYAGGTTLRDNAMVGRSIAAARPVGKFQALGALDFRRLWLSSIAFGVGQQMEAMILGWYVLVLTDSATIVGLVGAARWGGMLLAPFCGVLADRRPRRTLLIIVQSVSLTSMATAALLAATGRLSLPFLITAVLVAGLARAFDQTVRQTFVADLVDRERLTGAVALVQMAMNGSNIIAPLIAGRIYGFSGVAACYAVISALTLCAVLATSGIQSRAAGSVENRGVSPLRSMGEGLSYVRRTPIVGALLWIAAIANLCPFPLTFAMLPSFSRDVLHVGAGGLSVLLAAAGTGALLGNLVLGSLGLVRRRGIISLTGTFAWMAVLVLFGLSRSYPISLSVFAPSADRPPEAQYRISDR